MKRYSVPPNMPQKLDLHVPPLNEAAATGYMQLLDLLEELGRWLDEREVSRHELRQWEHSVLGHLHDREIDRFMRVSDDDAPETDLAEQRWKNLRAVLLARKGIRS